MKLGVGYTFGSKDGGVIKTLTNLSSGLLRTKKDADNTTSSAGRLRDTLLSVQSIQLGQISGKLSDMQSSLQGIAGSGIDTRMEQMFVQFDKGFARGAVLSGNMGAELKSLERQVFSTAFAMNRSADEVGANVLAMQRAGLSIEAIAGEGGSLEDVQKIFELTAMSGSDFAAVFQDLNKSWGFGEKGTRDFLDAFTSISVQMGVGEQAFAALPGFIDAIDSGFAHLDMKPEEIQSTILGMTKLGKALADGIGEDPQKAMQTATQMFSALAEEGKGFDQMVAGMGGDLGNLTKEFAFLGGGLTESLDAMRDGAKDPAAFMQAVARTMAQLDENGSEAAQTLKSRLLMSLSQISPSFSFLAQGGREVDQIFQSLTEVVPEAGDGMLETARKAHRSGLTLEESMDRARMGMEQAFGGASRKEREAFAQSMIKSYNLVGKTIRNLTGDSDEFSAAWREQAAGMGLSEKNADRLRSALGPLVGLMATFASTGVHGVLISVFGEDSALAGGLGVIASGLGELLPALLPIVALAPIVGPVIAGAFGTLATALSSVAAPALAVAAPLAAVAAAIAGLYLVATGKLESTVNVIKDKLEEGFVYVSGIGSRLLDAVTGFFDGLDGREVARSAASMIRDTIRGLFNGFENELEVGDEAQGAARALLSSLVSAVRSASGFARDLGLELLEQAREALQRTDWSALSSDMLSGLSGLFGRASELRGTVFSAVYDALDSVDWQGLFRSIGDRLLDMRSDFADRAVEMFTLAAWAIEDIDWAELGETLGEGITSAAIEGFSMSGRLGKKLLTILDHAVKESIKTVGTKKFWVDTWDVIVAAFKFTMRAFIGLHEFVGGIFKGIAFAAASALFDTDTFKDASKSLMEVFDNLWKYVEDGARALFGNSINSFVSHDFGIIERIVDTAKSWFYSLSEVAKTVFRGIMDSISDYLSRFKTVGSLITGIASKFGISAADISAIIPQSDERSGGSSDAAVQAVVQSGGNALASLLIEQTSMQRVYFEKISRLLSAAPQRADSPVRVPAVPTSTGGI